MKQNNIIYVCIIAFVLLAIIGLYVWKNNIIKLEGYDNYQLSTPGTYPTSTDLPILNSYAHTGNKSVSDDSSNNIWWHFPIFKVGSYEQITNNLRYRYNPDDGTCSRADLCGALYKNKRVKSNVIHPLPPAEIGKGARVNYYRSNPNLLYNSINTNENILY